jgi:TRAP-type C4-dicarboxylate transport system permease small subunit
MSLYNSPVQWAEQIAKTKLRLVFTILLQFGILMFGFWLYHLSFSSHHGLELDYLTYIGLQPLIIIAGFVMPSSFLIAIYLLLKIIRENEK